MDLDESRKKIYEENDEDFDEKERKPKYFGIKSYLHNFYDNNSSLKNFDYDEFDEDSFAVNEVKDKWYGFTLWRVVLIFGLLIMSIGIIMILVGFTFSKMQIDIGYQEEMRIIDKSAFEFNQNLEKSKIYGLTLFTVGGVLVASAVLLPNLMPIREDDEEFNHLEESTNSFKLRIDTERDNFLTMQPPSKNLIPVTEKLKVIQPKQETNSIITNSGLQQFDLN